jgi:hypothetical protein
VAPSVRRAVKAHPAGNTLDSPDRHGPRPLPSVLRSLLSLCRSFPPHERNCYALNFWNFHCLETMVEWNRAAIGRRTRATVPSKIHYKAGSPERVWNPRIPKNFMKRLLGFLGAALTATVPLLMMSRFSTDTLCHTKKGCNRLEIAGIVMWRIHSATETLDSAD